VTFTIVLPDGRVVVLTDCTLWAWVTVVAPDRLTTHTAVLDIVAWTIEWTDGPAPQPDVAAWALECLGGPT
jgi:hypothetical protein